MIDETETTALIDSPKISVTTTGKYYAKGYKDYAQTYDDEENYAYTT